MCNTFVDNNLHVTNWKRKLGCKCQYKNIVDWCGCSPNDFRLADWNRLEATKQRLLFFGRKFEAVVSQGIINQLESSLYPGRFEINYATSDRYWQSVYHYHDIIQKHEDSVLTVGSSLGRIASRTLLAGVIKKFQIEERIQEVESKLKELTVFLQNDRVEGILVRFDVQLGDALLASAESWFKLQNVAHFQPWSDEIDKFHSRIQFTQVGSDYDQKEQIFRNFVGSLGPLSEPTLAYHVYAGDEPLNLTFVWANPLQSVQAVQNFKVQAGTTANFAKPALKPPLTPGNWTVKILSEDGHLLAATVFLVSLAEFYHGQPISQQQHKILNIASSPEQKRRKESAVPEWTPSQLHNEIDRNTEKFYEYQASCLESGLSKTGISRSAPNFVVTSGGSDGKVENFEFDSCVDAPWSSLFPDAKSTITGIDPKTGLLLP